MPGTRKLGKTTDQRMAMLRQQVTDFLDNGKMETTVTRAKEIKPLAEKMITLGKKSRSGRLPSGDELSSPAKMSARRSSRRSLPSMRSATAAIPASSAPASAAAMLLRPLSSSSSDSDPLTA